MYPKANFTLFHFVIFSKVESDFPYLLRFSSYGAMFEHHFWAKTPIFGHFWRLFDSPAAQLSWDRRFCGWFIIRGLGPTFPPNLSLIGGILGPQILLFSHFLTFSLQSGGYNVIFKNFYKRYEIQTKNIAESDHQRNFCKKPHVKSSFRSEEDRSRSHRQTDTQIFLLIICKCRYQFWNTH